MGDGETAGAVVWATEAVVDVATAVVVDKAADAAVVGAPWTIVSVVRETDAVVKDVVAVVFWPKATLDKAIVAVKAAKPEISLDNIE